MKSRIMINLESTTHPEHPDYYYTADLCFATDQQPNQILVSKIDKEAKRLTNLSKRNKELYMEKTIRVDWGTLAYLTKRENGFNPRFLTSNCLGIEIKLTDYCRLKLLGPAIHFNTELLKNPNYQF